MLQNGILDSLSAFFSSIFSMFSGFIVPAFVRMTPLDILLGIFAFAIAIKVFITLFNEFSARVGKGTVHREGVQHFTADDRKNDER